MSVPASVQAKLRRADEHLNSFLAKIEDFNKRQPYDITRKRNADQTELAVTVHFHEPFPVEDLGLMLGDAIHCLRSALDHMIYAIAIKQSGVDPPPGAKVLQFPIVSDPAKSFNSDARWRLQDLRQNPAILTAVEGLQPNNRPEVEGRRVLAILDELDATDKHRLLNVVIASQRGSNFTILGQPIPHRGQVTIGPLKDGAEVFRLFGNAPLPPDVDVKPDLKVEIHVPHSPASDGSDSSQIWGLVQAIKHEVEYAIATLDPFT